LNEAIKPNPMAALAALVAGIGVVLGALGAHSLERSLSPEQLESFETGVRYQMFHALALLALSLTDRSGRFRTVEMLWLAGIALFSGSIYALSSLELSPTLRSVLGPTTPIGGLLLIAAWLVLAVKLNWPARA